MESEENGAVLDNACREWEIDAGGPGDVVLTYGWWIIDTRAYAVLKF